MTEIRDELKKITEVLVSEYKPDKIILFGSRARGDGGPDSDIDLLVVSDREKTVPRYKRGREVRLKLASVVPSVPLDVLFYTHEDLARFRGVRQSFSATVLREGVTLYG